MSLDELKFQIKEINIAQLIGMYMPLSKKGANWEGLCPFHSDRHPSFKVNESKRLYKCFVCGVSGDSIKFVQEFKKIDFVDAIKDIAGKMGLHYEESSSRASTDPEVLLAKKIVKAAKNLFQKYAQTKPQSESFSHFLADRKITPETAELFELGFMPDGNKFLHYLSSFKNEEEKKQVLNIAEKIVLIKNNNGSIYDTFRSRISFPIWDKNGYPVGFGSRSIHKDQIPKYLNSSESIIFHKRDILYPYHLAKNAIQEKRRTILVEGYMDALTLHQAGFKESLAIMGIAISEASAKFLSKKGDIYLCLDNDQAGFMAMDKINEIFFAQGILPRIILLGDVKDPDDFIKVNGAISFQKQIEESPLYIDWWIQKNIPEIIPDNKEVQLKILEKIMHRLKPLGMSLVATERIIGAAKLLKMQSTPEVLIEIYKNLPQGMALRADIFPESREKQVSELAISEILPSSDKPEEVLTQCDKYVLKFFIQCPDMLLEEKWEEVLDYTGHSGVSSLLYWLEKTFLEIDENFYADLIRDYVQKNFLGKEFDNCINSIIFDYRNEKIETQMRKRMLSDLLDKCKVEKLVSEKHKLISMQQECQSNDEAQKYITEIHQIDLNIKNLLMKNKK